MHLRFSLWHQLLMAFRRPIKLGELLGAIAVFAFSLRVSAGFIPPPLNPDQYPGFLLGLAVTIGFTGLWQLIYWCVMSALRGELALRLADLPEHLWVLVETETGLIPMADTGIHALVFQREDQTAPWLARYPATVMPECVDRDHTLSIFRTFGVKWVVYYHGEQRTTWTVLPLTDAGALPSR